MHGAGARALERAGVDSRRGSDSERSLRRHGWLSERDAREDQALDADLIQFADKTPRRNRVHRFRLVQGPDARTASPKPLGDACVGANGDSTKSKETTGRRATGRSDEPGHERLYERDGTQRAEGSPGPTQAARAAGGLMARAGIEPATPRFSVV